MAKTRRAKLAKRLGGTRKSGRFKGVSIGKDKDGVYVYTHRSRSKSYPKQSSIPDSVIKTIERTG